MATTTTISTDQDLVDLMRQEGPLSVPDLVELTGVTATAIRQRLNRLLAAGKVKREEVRNSGVGGTKPGRPRHHYLLTEEGFRSSGNNLGDLAAALWEEVEKIPDPDVRRKVLKGVTARLVELYGSEIEGDSTEERLQSIARFFGRKQIPFIATEKDDQTVLQIVGCPYPEVAGNHQSICEMEKELFSRLADRRLSLHRCECESGGHCCTFEPEQGSSPNDGG